MPLTQSPTSSAPKHRPHHMQPIDMSVKAITTPYPSVVRITAKADIAQPQQWLTSNTALRILLSQATADRQPVSRIYTVRAFHPERNEIEIDIVRHADASPAMQWLNTLQVGDTIQIIGPRPHFVPHFMKDKRVIMFADDTAIPATYSILQQWPQGMQADVYIESREPDIITQLPQLQNIQIHFHHQTQQHQGWLLHSAYQLTDLSHKTIWAACERHEAKLLREYFLQQHMPKEDVRIAGYWQDGVSSAQLDKIRAEHYQEHIQAGKTLAEYDDLDMPEA